MKNIRLTFLAAFALMFFSCDDFDTDLEVQNLEEPSGAQIGIEATADRLFQSWFNTVNAYNGPGLAMSVMADQGSMSWGNAAMWDTSIEPRMEWNNNETYGNAAVTRNYFNSLYAILADANAIMIGLEGDIEYSDPDKYESLARFGQAAAIGYNALVFDKVWPSDESGSLNNGEPVGYQEALQIALEKIDLAIAAADRGSFSIEEINGVTLSSDEWSQFLNSFAARLMVNTPRNAAQRDAVDWNKVLNYTQNGLTYDFEVYSDGWSTWYSEWIYYSIFPGWGRIDLRIINLMDESYPDYWPESESNLPPASSDDDRLESDFGYLDYQDFPADRGTYHWSTYRHKRYDNITNSGWMAPNYEMLKAENDLYMAEALLRLGDVAAAAEVINSGSRIERGGLEPVEATEEAVREAIHYERMIELINTGMGLGFFEMRGTDRLQEGTLLHFPVPGEALNAAGLPYYTFGGSTGTPGEDYSTGGWR